MGMKRVSVIFILILMHVSQWSFSQCKTYKLNEKGDTLNCTDVHNLKQGKWVTRVEENYGEPGYQETGVYKDGKKEGAWTRYNLMGDITAEEQYKWGYKDGICRYYNLMGLIREESWRATNPKNPYDTVRAYHLDNPDKYDLKIIKVEASTVRHGTWTYYDPQQGTITKTEEYVIDQLMPAKTRNTFAVKDSAALKNSADSIAAANKKKPPEVLEWEKKHQKKKIKVRDGATGVN